MPLSSGDRVLAGLVSAYFCFRLISAIRTGMYNGDGDRDVYSDRNPAAFMASLASGAAVAAICALIALVPNILVPESARVQSQSQRDMRQP